MTRGSEGKTVREERGDEYGERSVGVGYGQDDKGDVVEGGEIPVSVRRGVRKEYNPYTVQWPDSRK